MRIKILPNQNLAKFLSIFSICTLSACTIHPVPAGYVNGKFHSDLTVEIVKHVRCEFRDALMSAGVKLLLERDEYLAYGKAAGLADSLSNPPLKQNVSNVWDIHPIAQIRSSFFQGSSVQFNFDLQITEKNNQSAKIGINPTTGAHPFSLNVGDTSANLTRKNQRTFDIPPTTFSAFNFLKCAHDQKINNEAKHAKAKNWVYPIKGNINLAGYLKTFINYTLIGIEPEKRHEFAKVALAISLEKLNAVRLKRHGGKVLLSSSNRVIYDDALIKMQKFADGVRTCDHADPICRKDRGCYKSLLQDSVNNYNLQLYQRFIANPPEITDKLTFTTEFSGGIEPSITFATNDKSFKLASLGLAINPSRVDVHDLAIQLTAPQKHKPPSASPSEIPLGGNKNYALVLKVPGKRIAAKNGIPECENNFPSKKKFRGTNIANNAIVSTGPYLKPVLNPGELEETELRSKARQQLKILEDIQTTVNQ